uniref:Fibrinogen C-terminal domain-containing protein n=1 Tax=Amphimedon queenslandica TaxID=400682 RepID=A0A1X7TAS8_AMPQE
MDNLGRSFTIKGNGISRYILCPRVLPKSCQSVRSCKDLNSTINGDYTIYPDGVTPVEVYCDMNGINCDGEGGWTRVGYFNMTESGATCPAGLIQKNYTNIDHLLCGRLANSSTCISTTFSSNGLTYNKVCGQEATVRLELILKPVHVALDGGVGFSVLFATDPLWDGQQCDDQESTCCPANSKMPWFYRSLDTRTTDDIELRVCSSRTGATHHTPLDIFELYIK